MQTVHCFVENYIEPVIHHRAFQTVFKLTVEVVKIIAVKIFLECLTTQFLSRSARISKREIYQTVIFDPLVEEIFFRLVILQGIHFIQNKLNDFGLKEKQSEEGVGRFAHLHIQLSSNIFEASHQNASSDKFVINIYPPITEEILYRGYLKVICLVNDCIKLVFNRMHVVSTIFVDEGAERDSFVFSVNLPLEQELIYRVMKKGFELMNISSHESAKELTEKEKRERIQQIFRIHLSALIFAAVHLSNPHSTKGRALMQFVWTYFGGVTYGYLSEKYHSLAPGILAHGFNNSFSIAARIYSPDLQPYFILAFFVNRMVFYILGR